MFRFSLELAGVKQINRGLMIVASRVTDLRPIWEEVYKDFTDRERRLFVKQGDVGTPTQETWGSSAGAWGPWAPLDPAYAKRKRARGFGSKILVRTKRLRESLTQRGHADAVFVASLTSLQLGTAVPYAGYHQTGTKHMPAREPIRIGEAQARFWVRLVHKFLIESGQFERENP